MKNVLDQRSARYLATELPQVKFPMYDDKRSSHGLERPGGELLRGILTGLVGGKFGFGGMEDLTDRLANSMKQDLALSGRIPDTTARDFVLRADVDGVRDGLRRYVKGLHHRGMLDEVGNHMQLKMVSLDGKYDRARVRLDPSLGLMKNRWLIRELYPYFQADEEPRSGWLWGEVRTISVVLTNSPSTPCLDCVPVLGRTNEMGTFTEAFACLLKDWAKTNLIEAISVDAGMVSLKHAGLISDSGLDYIMAIKKSQPELHGKLEKLLDHRTTPDAETTQRYKGKNLTHRIWRTRDVAGWLDWNHLQQGILIRRTVCADGSEEPVEDEKRFYASSVAWTRLDHEQWLATIRAHWRVENNLHWTLDMILREGPRPWTRDPHGMLVMNILRRIAYNILARQRARTLHPDDSMIPWRELVERFYDALRLARHEDLISRRQRRWFTREAA